jgi:uncharacterized protein YndB with AHSA1/START domain
VTVSEINAVVCEIHVSASPETVFAFLVDPEKMARWMGSRVELNARPGGSYAVDINAQARARGEYVQVEPPSRVVFTFGWDADQAIPPGSTTVEITLRPDGDGTHVRLVHRGLLTSDQREQHRQGWQQYVGRLSVAAAGGDPGPDPNANPPQEAHR